jgi:hypothetical protein
MYKIWRRLRGVSEGGRGKGPVHVASASHILETNIADRRSHVTDWVEGPLVWLLEGDMCFTHSLINL